MAEAGVAMAEDLGSRAVGLLVDQAWSAYREGRYQEAIAAADRAVQAARHLDDLVLLVRALAAAGAGLQNSGERAGALGRYTEILGLAHDPASSRRLDDPAAAEAVARAHWNWVECAQFLTGIPVRDLFGALDAADRWLAATGHHHRRAAVLLERAMIHKQLGEYDAAAGYAEEASRSAFSTPMRPAFPSAPIASCSATSSGMPGGRVRPRRTTRPSWPTPAPMHGSDAPPTRAWPGARWRRGTRRRRGGMPGGRSSWLSRSATTPCALRWMRWRWRARPVVTWTPPGRPPPATWRRPGGSAATAGPITRPGPLPTSPWTAATVPPPGRSWPTWTNTPARWTPATGTTTYTAQAARRHQQLTELDAGRE